MIRPLAMVFMNIFVTSAKYSHYLMNIGRWGDASSTNLTHVMILSAALFMITVYRRQAESVIMSGKGGVSFYQFSLCFCIVYYVIIRLFADRVLMYSNYINVIALSALPKLVKEKHLRFMVRVGVIFMVALSWWYIYVRGNNSATYPYVSVLER